ncbi:MAG: TonB family protein, partial [Mariprofundaceae bacterium]
GVTGTRGSAEASVLAVQLVRAPKSDAVPSGRRAGMTPAAKPAPAKAAASPARAGRRSAQPEAVHGRVRQAVAGRRADGESAALHTATASSARAGGREGRASDAPRVVPERARGQFMAHIRYPWQARRMGWQGRVEIAFAVASRRVRDARVQKPSGYPVLDDAALAGVRRVGAVALADGRYVLPVRFVLR